MTGLESGGTSHEHTLPGGTERGGARATHLMLSGGKRAVRKLKRAQILLAADAGVSDEAIASSVSVGGSTVYRIKRRFVAGNLELALSEETRPGAPSKLSDKKTALLVATACSRPPQGRRRWTLDLLAGAMVRLTEHEGRDCPRCAGNSLSAGVDGGNLPNSTARKLTEPSRDATKKLYYDAPIALTL